MIAYSIPNAGFLAEKEPVSKKFEAKISEKKRKKRSEN
jgi:hypothetical protein